METGEKSRNHPERKPGEVFIGNRVKDSPVPEGIRLGKQAYDLYGNPVNDGVTVPSFQKE